MNDAVDKIRKGWEHHQWRAIEFGTSWAQEMMKDYHEPSRAGTPRGDSIGFSREKQLAAYLMILHSPQTWGIAKIAFEAKVSEAVLRVWKTRPDFKKVRKQACTLLGEEIAERIRSILSGGKKTQQELRKIVGITFSEDDTIDFWILLLAFFNPIVAVPFVSMAKKEMDLGRPHYAGVLLLLRKYTEIKDGRSFKKWNQQPWLRDLMKAVIDSYIDTISDSKAWKVLGAKKIKEIAEDLKKTISRELNIVED